MILYENTIRHFQKDIHGRRLVNFLCSEYSSATGKKAPPDLRFGWKYVFSILEYGLSGLPINKDAGIRIELQESIQFSHMSVIFASKSEEAYRYTVLGLYAGGRVRTTNASDIVCFSEGDIEWTTIHPSRQMSSYARRLFRGVPEREAGIISYESASFLFDCVFSRDCDIITDYDRQITDESSVFYANDIDELSEFLLGALSGGDGIESLRKLHTIEGVSVSGDLVDMNDDQIYLVSSITNNVIRRRKAWYIIEGTYGTGKNEVAKQVIRNLEALGKSVLQPTSEKKAPARQIPPGSRPDLVILRQKDGASIGQLDMADVAIYLYDELRTPDYENFKLDEMLTKAAAAKGAHLYISHLKQNMAFPDGGKGMRWIISRLQLADIQREDYDPRIYPIRLVDSEDVYKENPDMARITLPKSVTYDPAAAKVSIDDVQKERIFNHFAHRHAGAYILCKNGPLRRYLADEIAALEQRQEWILRFTSEIVEGNGESGISENIARLRQVDSGYEMEARSRLGEGAWAKTDEQSRIWIISALMAYGHLKDYDRMVDFSGVCVQIGKACELELKKRIFTAYLEYLKKKYGSRLESQIPHDLTTKTDGGKRREILTEGQVTLGNMRYIMGLGNDGEIRNSYAWSEFEEYARQELLTDPADPLKTMASQVPVIEKIKDDYRNPSAHSEAVTVVDAQECIEYVITVSHKLGILLDQYRF